MEPKKTSRKWCIVPGCESTTTKCSTKLFFYVPFEEKKRNLWIKAVRRIASDFSKSSCLYVCEDHFNLEQDMENYLKFKLMGGQKKLKSDVIPHIFACQVDRKRAAPKNPRKAATKRCHQQLIEEILTTASTSTNNTESTDDINQPSTSGTQTFSIEKTSVKSTQTESPPRIHYRSKKIQCNITSTKTVACSPFKVSDDSASPSSPKNVRTVSKKLVADSSNSDSESVEENDSQKYESFTSTDFDSDCEYLSSSDIDKKELNEEIKKISLERILKLIPLRPRLYLGLPEDCFYIINLLQKYTPVPLINIYVVLKKIRTAYTFASLADDFGMSESNVSRIFANSVTLLSGNLIKFIMWPSKQKIKQLLPLAFIAHYSNVESIIDCLEIEIEKPTNPIHQSLTWSDYKSANTLKYLISSTPNGIINFISTGFGGRATDALIVEESGFLQTLPPGAAVMADRGFKHIEHLLIERQCSLIRPPSVEKNKKSSKAEVLETKRIASLRIHVERVIRRLREFKMLKPHSCINKNLIQYTDHIIVIACAHANMQAALIK